MRAMVPDNNVGQQHDPFFLYEDSMVNCTVGEPTDHGFPIDIFTEEQRQNGALALHVIAVLYLIGMIVTVCERYFIPSLSVISTRLKIQADVAGATFMAAGGSAPELFTSTAAALLTNGDSGLGTMVGSGVFNIYFILGVVALSSFKLGVDVNSWPVFRDGVCYVLSVAILLIVTIDEMITWYEALLMVIAYILYCVMQAYNHTFQSIYDNLTVRCRSRPDSDDDERQYLLSSDRSRLTKSSITVSQEFHIEQSNETVNIFEPPEGFILRAYWLIMLPGNILIAFTIPDSSNRGKEKWVAISFTMCVLWMGSLSYILLWMATTIGETLEIPDIVMGLTVLAAGTSMPDALSSVIVAHKGEGSMAVTNCLGSNVFDLLLCLGLPWLLRSLIVKGGDPFPIQSDTISLTVGILMGSALLIMILFPLFKWKLSWQLGVTCLITYTVVIGVVVYVELQTLC